MTGLKQYMPTLGMILAVVAGAFVVALGDNVLDASEWFMVTTALCGAVTTYVVPRFTTLGWLKPLVAAVTAGVGAAGAAFITDGISAQEWFVIGIQVLGGFGIVVGTNSAVPETPTSRPSAV